MRVLIVEDEIDLATTLADGLRAEGFIVEVAGDGAAALARLERQDTDVVVLDRDLPVVHGDTVCRELAARGNPARILMLTASGTLADRVRGLDMGADDYLPKPFAYLELLARIRALGRRTGVNGADASGILERQGIRLDTRRRLAERDGKPLRLTPKEMGVLQALLEADGGVLTPVRLLDEVWDDPFDRTQGVVKVVVHSLRRKLGDPPVLHTEAGHGYRIR